MPVGPSVSPTSVWPTSQGPESVIRFLFVVVKVADDEAFVLTAYLTDKIEKGVRLWPIEK